MSAQTLTDSIARLFAQQVRDHAIPCPTNPISSIHAIDDIDAEVEVIFRRARHAKMSIFLDKSGMVKLGTPPEGAVILHPEQVSQILTGRPAEPVPTFATATAISAASLGLRKLKAAIWDAAPGPREKSITQKALFGLVKKLLPKQKQNSHFRTTVRLLYMHGYLAKSGDGLRKSDNPPRKPDKNT